MHFQFQIQFQFHLIAIVLLPLFCYLFVFLLEWEDTTGNKKEARVTIPKEARSKMTRNNFWPEIIYLVFVLFVCSRSSSARLYVCSLYMVIYLVLYVFFHNNKHVDFFDLIFPVSFVYFCVFVWFTILKIYGLMG